MTKVSRLIDLLYLSNDDVFLVTDVSYSESKKIRSDNLAISLSNKTEIDNLKNVEISNSPENSSILTYRSNNEKWEDVDLVFGSNFVRNDSQDEIIINMNSIPEFENVRISGSPTYSNDLVNKGYVDDLHGRSFVMHEAVISKNYTNPDNVSPNDGDRYWIGGTGVNEWEGHNYEIAEYNGDSSSWEFEDVTEGDISYVEDESRYYFYNGSTLVELSTSINHDQTINFESNEHINHGSVHINAGNGLSGGGDITTNRTINIDVNSLDLTIPKDDDELLFSDISDGDLPKKAKLRSLVDVSLSGGDGVNYSAGTISVDSSVVRTTDTDVSGNSWVLDEDNLSSNSDIKVPTQQSVKTYVDSVEQGLDIKDSVRVATDGTTDIDLTTSSDPNPIDGVTLQDGDRILLKDQSDDTENGIYIATTANDPSTWSRSSDANEDSEVNAGMFTFVEEGIENANRGFVLISSDPITLGTSSINFTQFSGSGQIQAGTGLSKSGDTLYLDSVVDELNDVDTSGKANGYALIYNSSTSNWEPGEIISTVEKRPDDFNLDDVNTNVEFKSIFGAINTVGFGSSNDEPGSVWLSFKYPYGFDPNKDTKIEIVYSLDGSDDSKSVELETDVWSTSMGSGMNSSSPEVSYTDTITSSSSNIGVLQNLEFSNGKIPTSIVSSVNDFIIIKFTRNDDSDTYTGTFHLVSMMFYQS